jgi:hypothetical protein
MRMDELGIDLRLSGQRALWGNVPTSLRAVSVQVDGNCIRFRAIFDVGATEYDKELLSCAATEIISDFSPPMTIEEEYIEAAAPGEMEHLRYLLFERAQNAS